MKPLLALALMTLAANNIRAQVVINELMQSNETYREIYASQMESEQKEGAC